MMANDLKYLWEREVGREDIRMKMKGDMRVHQSYGNPHDDSEVVCGNCEG